MRVQIGPYEDWRVRTVITYRLLPGCVIEAEYSFAFDAAYRDFEAFISNYFHGAWPPFLRLDHRWAKGRLDDQQLEHRYWCRSTADRERLLRALPSRLAEFPQSLELVCPVDEALYSEPVIATFVDFLTSVSPWL